MKYLLIGAGGMLARAVRNAASEQGHEIIGLDLPDFDLTNEAQVKSVVSDQYDAVLNCSAYTNVDAAETDEARATLINGQGVAYLAQACAARARGAGRRPRWRRGRAACAAGSPAG
jgi:dTDP-4-dehydrorhamnose reductase